MADDIYLKPAFKPPNYDEKVDFNELARQDSEFEYAVKATGGNFNFQKAEHVMQLTKSLLKRDFGVRLQLPNDRLCPPVPNRWAYIRWIQDLLDTTTSNYSQEFDPVREAIGIDIGVGASCIYPLLGCVARPKWRFYGTEIDQKSYEYALHNVLSNDFDHQIKLFKSSALHPLFPLHEMPIESADFTMCNPPFFKSKQEMMGSFEKDKRPNAVCTGSDVEMITEGGEADYVSRMVVESHALGTRVQWYTSQLGKLATLSTIVAKLEELNCHNWAVGVLMPNAITRRWVIGWSWNDLRPANHVARPPEHGPAKELLPYPTTYFIDTSDQVLFETSNLINTILSVIPLQWEWNSSTSSGIGSTKEDVWSRAARRKRKRQEKESDPGSKDESNGNDDVPITLAFRVIAHSEYAEVQWLKGVDLVLWESFCAMLKRQLAPSGKQVPLGDSEGKSVNKTEK